MINPISYVKNVGKSFGYAFWDAMTEMNPTIKSAIDTNKEIAQEMYAAVKDFKTTKANIINKVTHNEYWELGSEAKKNLFDDLKSGKWYNKERKDQVENEMMNAMMGGGDGFDFDDFDFGDNSDDSSDIDFESAGESDDSWDQTNSMEDMMDTVGEKVTNGLSTATVRSAEYIAESNKNIAKQNAAFQSAMFGKVNAGLAAINANISNIIPMGEALNTHIQNSSVFFTKSTELLEQQTKLLEEIAKNTTPIESEKKTSKNNRRDINAVLDSEGMLDLSSYFEAVKDNITDMTSMFTSMSNMMGEGTNIFKSFIASPMEYLLTGAIKSMTPKATKDMMDQFNKTLSGVFSSLFMKTRDAEFSGNPVYSMLSKIFGVTDYMKTSLNTGNYIKTKVDFDGITRKAIIEVIPTYLSKILSAVSGQEETRYDYDRGKFKTRSSIEKDKKKIISNEASFAGFELKDLFDQFAKNRPDEKMLKEMFNKFMERAVETGEMYNPRTGDQMGSFGLDGDAGEAINDFLRDLTYNKKKSHILTNFNKNVLFSRSNISGKYEKAESLGSDILNSLYNDSFDKDKKIIGSSFDLNNMYDNKHNNIFYYLQGIYQFTQGIYENGSVGGVSSDYKSSNGVILPGGIRRGLREIADNTPLNASKEVKEEFMSDTDFEYMIKPLEKDPVFKTKLQDIINRYGEYSSISDEETKKSMITQVISLKKEKENKEKQKREDKEKGGIFDRMRESDSVPGKIKEIIYGVDNLLRTPAEAVSKLIDSATVSINNLLYGKEEGDEEDGFLGYIFKQTKQLFSNFNTWINDHILNPLAEKFNIHSAGDLFKQVFKIFGVDVDRVKDNLSKAFLGATDEDGKRKGGLLSGIINATKSDLKSSLSWSKNAIKGSMGAVRNILTGEEQPSAANGGYVTKTGMITVSEGELVIPSEMNPFYNKITNKAKQIKDESNAFKKFYGSFYGGGTVGSNTDVDELGDKIAQAVKDGINKVFREKKTKKKKSKNSKSKDSDSDGDGFFESAQEKVEEAKDAVQKKYQELKDTKAGKYLNESAKSLKDGINSFLFGGEYTVVENGKEVTKKKKGIFSAEDDKKENKEFKQFTKNAMKEIGVPENISGMITGGLIGGVASFLTGGVVSPLMGAALGAGSGLIIKSKAVQDALFGTEDKDGALPKEVADFVKNKLPTIGKFGLTGALASMITGLPGGPVTGIVLGSALGIAIQNEDLMDRIVGPKDKDGNRLGGVVNKEIQDRIKKALPAMGAGAIAGLIAGPFGLVPNILIGSAIGFASTSDKFQDAIFGKRDEKGNRDGNSGLVGYIRNDLFAPVKDAFAPIKQAVIHGFKNFSKTVTNSLTKAFKESIGVPLWLRLKEKMLDPFLNVLKKSKILTGISKVVSAPFKAIGGLGRGLRTKQIRSGIATDMTAAERKVYRNKYGLGQDQFSKMDETLDMMDKSSLQEELSRIQELEKKTKDQYKDLNKSINYKNLSDFGFNATTSEKIIKMAINDDLKHAQDRVDIEGAKLGLDKDTIKKAKDMVKKISSDYKSKKSKLGVEEQDNFDRLSEKFGVNFSRKNIGDLSDALGTEIKDREKNREEDKERVEGTFRTEIIESADNIHNTLFDIFNWLKGRFGGTDARLQDNRSYQYDEDGNPVMVDDKGNLITPREPGETPEIFKQIDALKDKVSELNQSMIEQRNALSNTMAGTIKPAISEGISNTAELAGNIVHGTISLASDVKQNTLKGIRDNINSDINGSGTAEDKKSLFEKLKEKFSYVPTSSGKLIKQKFNTSGDPIPDMSDKETRQTVLEEQRKTDAQIGIGDTVTGIKTSFGSLIDRLFGKKDDEKKPSLFDSMKEWFLGKDGKGGLVNNIKDTWKFFTNGGGPIGDTLFGKLLNNVVGPALFVGAFSGLFDNLFAKFGWGNANNTTGAAVNGVGVKSVNGQTVDQYGNIVNTSDVTNLRTDTDNFSQKVRKGELRGALTGANTLGKVVFGRTNIGKGIGSAIGTVTKAFSVDDAVAAASRTQIGDDILNACIKFTGILRKLPGCSAIANYLDDMGIELAEKITSKLASQSAKNIGQLASNAVIWLKVAYIATDFTTGYEDARTTLGIVQEPTIPQRIVSGLLRAIKNFIPVIGPLIPDDLVINVFCKYVAPAFGIDVNTLMKEREESLNIVNEYNAKNGTNLDVKQYNKQVLQDYTWTERVGNAFRSTGTQTKLKFQNAAQGIKEKGIGGYAKSVYDGMATDFMDSYNNAGGGVAGAFDGIGTTFRNILPGVFGEIAQKNMNIISLAHKGELGEMWKISLDDFSQREAGEDGVEKAMPTMFSKIIGQIPLIMTKVTQTPFALLNALINKVGLGDARDAIGNGIVSGIGKIINTGKEMGALSLKGDLKGLLTYSLADDDANPLLKYLGATATIFPKIMLAPSTMLSFVGRQIGSITKDTFEGHGISDIVQVFSDFGRFVKDGNIGGLITYDPSNKEEDKPLYRVISNIGAMYGKVAFAGPTLVSALGHTIVNTVSGIVNKVKYGAEVITSNFSDGINSINSGESLADFLTVTEPDPENPMGGIMKAIAIGSRFAAVPFLFGKKVFGIAGGFVNSAIDKVKSTISQTTEGISSIGSLVAQGDPIGILQYTIPEDEENPANGLSKAIVCGSKVVTMPAAAAIFGFKKLGGYISNLVSPAIQGLSNIGTSIDDLKDLASNGDLSGIDNYQFPGTSEEDPLSGFKNGLFNIMKMVFKIPAFVNKILNSIPLFGNIKDAVSEKFDSIDNAINEKKDELVNAASGIWNNVTGFFSGSGSNFISQRDPRYANVKYSSSNMANEGCGPAAAAMAVNAAKGNNIVSMRDSAAYARRNGFENNQGTSADYFGSMFNSNGLQAKYMVGGSTNEIVSEIAAGHPTVLLGQDSSNTSKARSPFGAGNHYVVANGFDRNGNVIVNDPELGRGNAVYNSSILRNVKLGISASGTRMKRNLYKQFRPITGGGDNRATCWAYFKQQGCSDEVAAAIIGNLMAESGCNPGSIEKGNGNAGFGIAQWSYGRRTAFEQYAASRGVRADDISIQLEYLWKEIMGGETTWASLCRKQYGSIDKFIQLKNIDEATEFYCFKFERPNAKYAHLDRRISEARKAYTEFSGKQISADFSNIQTGDTGDITANNTTSSNGNPLTSFMGMMGKLQSAMFGKVGALFGIGDSSSTNTTSDSTTTTTDDSGAISANPTGISYSGNSPLDYMKSVQGKLAYSMTGPRNPDKGSADCSSTVQWAIKKATGVDIGGDTGSQITSSNLETVWSNNGAAANKIPDNIQPNDVLFFSRPSSTRKFKVGHVELYAGDGKMIGHGGGNNGTTPGPTIKPVTTNTLVQVSRVKESGSGSGLINGFNEVRKVGTYKGKVIPISAYSGGESALDNQAIMNSQINKAISTINKGGNNNEDLISLIKSIITLLQTLTNNTSKVDTIASLLKDYFNAKVKASASGTQPKTNSGKLVSNSSNNSPIIVNNGGDEVPDLDTATKNMISFLNDLAVG